MKSLSEFREEMDEINDELVRVLEKRFALVREISDCKLANNHELIDPTREQQMREQLANVLTNSKDKYAVLEAFEQVLEVTHKVMREAEEGFGLSFPREM